MVLSAPFQAILDSLMTRGLQTSNSVSRAFRNMDSVKEELELLVNRIFAIDPHIRYAAFVNANANVMAGGLRQGVRSFDSDEQLRFRMLQLSIMGLTFRDWQGVYKDYKFAMLSFGRIAILQIPFRDMMLNLSVEPSAPTVQIVNEITKILGKKAD